MSKKIVIKHKFNYDILNERRRVLKENKILLTQGNKHDYDLNCCYLMGIAFVMNCIKKRSVK